VDTFYYMIELDPRMSKATEPKAISPEPIFQMATSYWVSKTLMTAVEMDLFTKLKNTSRKLSLEELQSLMQLESRPADIFATALASIGLLKVEKRGTDTISKTEHTAEDDRLFSNSELADTFLVKEQDSYMGDIIAMFDKRLYKAWDKLIESLRTNKPIPLNEGGDAESLFRKTIADHNQPPPSDVIQQIQSFTNAMYGISVGPALALSRAIDFSKHNRMMDIGGGSGVYAIEVVKAHHNMSAIVIDLEPVCQIANQYIKKFGLENRIKTKSLDIFNQDLPNDCDVAFLSFILHDYNELKNRSLVKKIFDSLPDGGIIIISEWLLNDEKTGPISSALMGLNMMIETEGGRGYTFVEISKMLKDTGFIDIRKHTLAGPASIMVAQK